MGWCFATVNKKLAEIYFDKYKKGIKFRGHCYVKKEEYRTKKEQRWIEKESVKYQLVYRKGVYRDLNKPDLVIYT